MGANRNPPSQAEVQELEHKLATLCAEHQREREEWREGEEWLSDEAWTLRNRI